MRILIAKTASGKLITLAGRMSRKGLFALRKREAFYCLQCHEKVMLKIGEVKIPHFAHLNHSTCRSLFAEGESVAHLAGKQQLFTFFKEQKALHVRLEPFIKELAQRPDLLVETAKGKVPIEFQCSTIPIADIAKRTAGYRQVFMQPIWILATPNKLRQLPQGVVTYSLSRFEESFLTRSSNEKNMLLTYNSNSKKFHYLSAFLRISGRKFIVNHRVLSLTNQSFPFAEPNELTEVEYQKYYWLYVSHREKFLRNRILYNRKGINDPFLQNCYRLRLIPSELPLWIGVPITFDALFDEHDCEWQLALLYFIQQKGLSICKVTANDLYEFAYHYGRMEEGALTAFGKYVEFLRMLGVTSLNDDFSVDELQKTLLQYLQKGMKIEKI